jgi:hypothetical protein
MPALTDVRLLVGAAISREILVVFLKMFAARRRESLCKNRAMLICQAWIIVRNRPALAKKCGKCAENGRLLPFGGHFMAIHETATIVCFALIGRARPQHQISRRSLVISNHAFCDRSSLRSLIYFSPKQYSCRF